MEIVLTPIQNIRPYENNPRINDAAVKAVAESIREFGWKQPIVVDQDGVIIAGHTRYKAALMLGYDAVPIHYANDLTPGQVAAYRLADNKTHELSIWDDDLLQAELKKLSELEFDMEAFGFEAMGEVADKEIFADEAFNPEPPKEPKAKMGDVYLLGNHRLMCGDSTVQGDVERLMDGEHSDLLLTDPPYNVGYTGKTEDALTIENDNMDDEAYKAFLYQALECAYKAMKPGAAFYMCHADTYGHLVRQACAETGLSIKQILVWAKNSFVIGRQDYQWQHEPIVYGWKPGAAHRWMSDRRQSTILEFDRPSRNVEHPTIKPVGLFAYLIGNNTCEGDIVLDLFGGSGTSMIACEQMNRRCYTMEYDPRYVDVIIGRWEQFTGQKAKKCDAERW